jgi:adenylate cyclase
MADVFISYARSTAAQAEQIAGSLRALGYAVWRDDELPAHRAYAEVIEERLKSSKAVVVVWSADAVKSQWVRAEADVARLAGALVQLTIDGAAPPLPFNQIQCADMAGWTGDPDAAGWLKVVASVAELTHGEVPGPIHPPAAPQLPSKPSIAVLPFANLSNDPEQEYFVDGMLEEIVAALARFKSIFVIGAGSGRVFKGKDVSPSEAARQLGVHYVLEGSVRKAGGHVRIAVHLINASNGAQVWSDRFDDTLEDIFALQDRVAQRVAGVVDPAIEDLRIETMSAPLTDSTGSYDLYLRALPPFWKFDKDGILEAIDLLDRAIAIDPNFAMALSQSAVCRRMAIDNGWAEDPQALRRQGLDRVERALRVGSADARVLAQAATALPGLEGSLDRALVLIDRAIEMNPGSSFVWLISGTLRLRSGEADVAAEHLETAMRLDPISTMNGVARTYLAMARFQQGQFEAVLAVFRTTTFRLPASYAVLAAVHGHMGRTDEAREALSQFKARSDGGVQSVADIWFPQPAHRQLLLDGIALAEGKVLSEDAAEG